ncbi:hypothetical protein V7S43_006028 [Phytophthora oleae]|uniref:Anaphase-promoting complex subunit 4 n=1 Tax=Phytophthora oleae TaxID=2107226 RepID=A0ABD3FPD4_9STRA
MPPKRAFVALQDRFVSSLAVACCPTMDLIAVLTLDHHLLVHRTTSWQKLMHIKPSDIGFEMLTLAWRPDGLQLAVGCDEGDVAIFEIESGESLPERSNSLRHGHCITAMRWAQINKAEAEASDLSCNGKRGHWEVSRDSGDDNHAKHQLRRRSARFLNCFSEDKGGQDTVLVTADERGFIALWWMGRVLLTRIDLRKHFGEEEFAIMESMGHQRGEPSGFRINRVDVTPDFSLLFVLVAFSSNGDTQHVGNATEKQIETETSKQHRMLTLDVTAIQHIHDDVALVANTVDRVHGILSKIATAGRQMTTEWKNATRIFELKMGLIGSLYEKYACEDPPQVDMLSVVVTGITAPALAQYFAQDIQEMSVHRMQKALFSGCDSLKTLADEKMKLHLVELLFLVSELRGHAKWDAQTYARTIGITVKALDDFVQNAQDAIVELETLTLALHETRQDFALFFQWILERIRIHTNSPQSRGGAAAAGRDANGSAPGTKSLLNLRRLCDFFQRAADFAKDVKKQQPSHSIYKVETTFGNRVSQQFSGGKSPGCLALIKSLEEKWTAILDGIGATLEQTVVCEKSGCFTVGSSGSTLEECHVHFRQPFSAKMTTDTSGEDADEEYDEDPIEWDALKHFGPTQHALDNWSSTHVLIGFRLQSGTLLLLRAYQDDFSPQIRRAPSSRLTWEAAVVKFSAGSSQEPLICKGFNFYGDTPTKKSEQLTFIIDRVVEGQVHQEWLYLQQYDDIKFSRSNPSTSFEAIFTQSPIHTFTLDQLRGRVVASLPSATYSSKSSSSVIATASRGVLCAILPPSRLTVFDAEDSEDDDEEGHDGSDQDD